MSEENRGSTSAPPEEQPIKRKRGRPRKDTNLVQAETTSLSPVPNPPIHPNFPIQPNPVKRSRPAVNTNTALKTDNNEVEMVGKPVSGVLDGLFDSGYLLTVRVGDSNTLLRGVVFEPALSVPVSGANDIAPHTRTLQREAIPLPRPVVPPSRTPDSAQIIQSSVGFHTPSNHAPKVPIQHLSSSSPISFIPPTSMAVKNFSIQLTEFITQNSEGSSNQVFPETVDTQREECHFPQDKVGHSMDISPKERVASPLKNNPSCLSPVATGLCVTEKAVAPASDNVKADITVLQENPVSSIPGTTDVVEDASKGPQLQHKPEAHLEMSLGTSSSDETLHTEVIGSEISAWRDKISLSKSKTDESLEVLQKEANLPSELNLIKKDEPEPEPEPEPELENINGVYDDTISQLQEQTLEVKNNDLDMEMQVDQSH